MKRRKNSWQRLLSLLAAGSLAAGLCAAGVAAGGLLAAGCGDDDGGGTPVCGNGRVESGEQCDDGNTANNDGCSAGCVLEFCGDGVIQTGIGEQCDDANTVSGDGCSSTCQNEGVCGNGQVEAGEQCDDGNQSNNDACPDGANGTCQNATCGDGFVWNAGGGTEECDDGNTTPGDGCDENCHHEGAECGNGVVETGEQCDDGNTNDNDGCDSDCQLEVAPGCGNGVLEAGEQCDDGNGDNNDSCPDDSTNGGTCQNATCGDGFIWSTDGGSEQCDDGNTANNDGCSAACQLEVTPGCGNGVVEVGEQCDDGNQNNNDACPDGTNGTCQHATCGDGFVWNTDGGSEQCDDGNQNNNDSCPDGANATCQNAVCGDGFVWNTDGGSETCDDGDGINNDSCPDGTNGTCQQATCGDGFVWNTDGGTEQCDDGNHTNNDSCPDDPNATPAGTCQNPTCGDGFVWNTDGGSEQCDDGNHSNTDACPDNPNATPAGTCQDAFCGDGFLWAGHEGCDDGGNQSGDGCSATCTVEGCGNGVVDAGEQCDDGNNDNTDACPDDPNNGGTCQNAFCGDGFVRAGIEQCDDGNQNNNDACPDDPNGTPAGTCQTAYCGDGFVYDQGGTEQCDDGGTQGGDGCSANCTFEACIDPTDCGDPNAMVCDVASETCQPTQCTPSSTDCGTGCSGTYPCCLEQWDSSGLGACYELCDPFDILCPSGMECTNVTWSQALGLCQNPGTGNIGAPCNPTGDASALGTNTGCVAGAVCLTSGGNDRCYETCDFFDTNPACSGGRMCDLWGYCYTAFTIHNVAPLNLCPGAAAEWDACGPKGDGYYGVCLLDTGNNMWCIEFCPVLDTNYVCQGGATCTDFFTDPSVAGDLGLCL